MSKINNQAWEQLKQQMEYHLNKDSNITDISINYQVKPTKRLNRNYLKLNVKSNNH